MPMMQIRVCLFAMAISTPNLTKFYLYNNVYSAHGQPFSFVQDKAVCSVISRNPEKEPIMTEPSFTVLLVCIDQPPGKSRCPKCKKEFFNGDFYVAVKIRTGQQNQWYLAGVLVQCCGQEGKTLWATNDEQEALSLIHI